MVHKLLLSFSKFLSQRAWLCNSVNDVIVLNVSVGECLYSFKDLFLSHSSSHLALAASLITPELSGASAAKTKGQGILALYA